MSKNSKRRRETLILVDIEPDTLMETYAIPAPPEPEPFPENTPMADAAALDRWTKNAEEWR